MQRRFVSDVSHELRTPLTTIRMAADVLHDSREDFDPATARSAELLQTQLDRFESLLADLLEISRYDAGAAVLDVEPVDVGDLVRAGRRGHAAARRAQGGRRQGRGARRAVRRLRRPAPGRPHPAQPAGQRDRARRGASRSTSRSPRARTPWRSACATTGWACVPASRRWCSTASGAVTPRGRAPPAAPASACRSRSRTPGCTVAGSRRGASRGDGAHFRLTLPRRALADLVVSPLAMEPADASEPAGGCPIAVGARPGGPRHGGPMASRAGPVQVRARQLVLVVSAVLVLAGVRVHPHEPVQCAPAARCCRTRRTRSSERSPGRRCPGMTDVQLVSGFLQASADFDSDHGVAREFLTSDAASTWNPAAQTVVYDDSQPVEIVSKAAGQVSFAPSRSPGSAARATTGSPPAGPRPRRPSP